MTNGIVSVIENGTMRLKIIAGCSGYNADNLAHLLKIECEVPSMETAYSFAEAVDFGCKDCLVVQSPTGHIFKGADELGPLYREHFHDPQFNPRWERGNCGHLAIVEMNDERHSE